MQEVRNPTAAVAPIDPAQNPKRTRARSMTLTQHGHHRPSDADGAVRGEVDADDAADCPPPRTMMKREKDTSPCPPSRHCSHH